MLGDLAFNVQVQDHQNSLIARDEVKNKGTQTAHAKSHHEWSNGPRCPERAWRVWGWRRDTPLSTNTFSTEETGAVLYYGSADSVYWQFYLESSVRLSLESRAKNDASWKYFEGGKYGQYEKCL